MDILTAENARLTEEVRHLKEELAKRPLSCPVITGHMESAHPTHAFNTRPFTPVPRKRQT